MGLKLVAKRSRPAQVTPQVELQDDAPVDGPSYPSGHAAIACSAHFPMDAVGGALLGLAVGCGLRAVFGAPAR